MVFGTNYKRKGAQFELLSLVCKFVLFGAKTWQSDTISVAPLGYDIENIKLGFLIVFHCRNFFGGY